MGEQVGSGQRPYLGQARSATLPFIGRCQQRDWFEACCQDVLGGHPHVVFMVGEAGVGKTRLLREFRGMAQQRGFQVLLGRGYEDLVLPYLPFVETLLPLLDHLPHTIQQALTPEVSTLRLFLHRLGAETSVTPVVAPAGSEQEKLLIFMAVSRLLMALAQHQPFALFLDDLHWADSSSLDLVSYIVFAIAEAALRAEALPLLMLSTLRPAASAGRLARLLARVQQEEVCETLELPCLREAEVHDLLQGLGLHRPSQQLVTTVLEATQGNPLFVQEVVQHLLTQNLLCERAGYLATTVAPADLQLPEKLTSAIGHHIQALSPACRNLLTLAACFGERFTFDLLAAVSGDSEDTLLALLEEGMQHRLLLSRTQTLQFTHPLVCQAFYSAALPQRRQRVHQRIAQMLEQRYAACLEEHTLEIAHHVLRAGAIAAPSTVLAYARQAGDQACRAFAWCEAARYYEAALATGVLSPPEQARLHYQAGFAYHRDQDMGPCVEHYNSAIAVYRAVGDVRGLAHVLMLKTELEYSLASVPLGTLPDLQPLTEVSAALGDAELGLRGRIFNVMALAYRNARQTSVAQQMATRALEIGQHLEDDVLCAYAGNTLGQIQGHTLQVKASSASFAAAATAARRTGDLWLQGLPLQRLPLVSIMLGQLAAAESAALEACTLAHTTQDWGNYSLPLAHLTYVHVTRGTWDAAQRTAQEALRVGARASHAWGGTRTLLALASMHTCRGAWEEAEQALDALIEPGRIWREPGPMLRTVVQVFRRMIRAYAGEVQRDIGALLAALQHVMDLDIYSLAPCCALVELSALLEAPDLAAYPAQVLAEVARRDVLFTPEWVFLVPRVLGLAATLQGAWDQAETYFQAAIRAANEAGAQPELTRTYVDYARMLLARQRGDDWAQAQALLTKAAPLCQTLGMQPYTQHIRHLLSTLAVCSVAPSQPQELAPVRRSRCETDIWLRRARASTYFLG